MAILLPPFSCRTLRAKPPPSKRVWADDFPAVALAEFVAFIVVDRSGAFQELLDVAAGGGRGVQKQDAAGFAAGVLPSMRDVAREERAGAGPADGNIVASPASTQATSSLSWCRWKRLLVPARTVSWNSMMLSTSDVRQDTLAEEPDRLHDLVVRRPARMGVA